VGFGQNKKNKTDKDFNQLLEGYEALEKEHDMYKNRCHEYQILTNQLKAELEEVRKKYYILQDQHERLALNKKRSAEDYDAGRGLKKQRKQL